MATTYSEFKIASQPQFAQIVEKCISRLSKAVPRLDTQTNITLLNTHPQYADRLMYVLLRLGKALSRLDTPENISLLDKHAQHATRIAYAILCLSRAAPRLDTQANFTALFQYQEFLEDTLHKIEKTPLMSQDILNKIIDDNRKSRVRREVATTFVLGKKIHPGLFGQTQLPDEKRAAQPAPLAKIVCEFVRGKSQPP